MPLRPFRPRKVSPRRIQHAHQKGTQPQCDRDRHLVLTKHRGRAYGKEARDGRDSDDGEVNEGAKTGIPLL